MRKSTFVILLAVVAQLWPSARAHAEPGRIPPQLLKAVVKIEVPSPPERRGRRRTGTGFLVSRALAHDGRPARVSFLVTNKHLLGDWNLADGRISTYHRAIKVFFYRKAGASGPSYAPIPIALVDDDGSPKEHISLHPDPHIDIALIRLDAELFTSYALDLVTFDAGELVPFDQIMAATATGLGDQVFALGYPHGITSLRDNYPVAKAGYLSSVPGVEFAVEVPLRNRRRERVTARLEGKILLLDGVVVGGNSGGPVVLPVGPEAGHSPPSRHQPRATGPNKNLVLGVVSGGISSAGLAMVYSADYILDLLDRQGAEGPGGET